MLRPILFAFAVVFLTGCVTPSIPTSTSAPAPYLSGIRFDDSSTVFAQPINVRMQGIARRDFNLRLRIDLRDAPEGMLQDITYRGSVRTAPRPDGRITFSIYVDSIDGGISVRGQPQRIDVRATGLSQLVFESVHNLDNTLHELSLPLLNVLIEEERRGALRQQHNAARLRALLTLSENVWPLFPVRKSRLAVGTSIWPETAHEMRHLFDNEMVPALSRSQQMRDFFNNLSAAQGHGVGNYEAFVSELGAGLAAMFASPDSEFGGRITGTRVWNGQEVLESVGPIRGTAFVGSGLDSAAIRINGSNHMLIDPFSGVTVRSEYSAAVRIAMSGGQVSNGTQQISVSIAQPERSLRVSPRPSTSGSQLVDPRGDVPAGGTARRISEIYSESIGSIFTVRAGASQGTGFAISRDVILTNRHVVENARDGRVDLVQNGAVVARARIERTFDGAFDLAILRSERPLDISPLALAQDLPAVGTEVLIIGSPIGLEGSITGGIVSQLRVIARAGYVQVDAAINPGNSGGPVFDRLGRVVGIATMRLEPGQTGGRGVVGIGFALSSETVRELLASARVSASLVER